MIMTLDRIAGRLHETVAEHGPDSVMILASAKITNEENPLAQKFARAVIGANNADPARGSDTAPRRPVWSLLWTAEP